jgi:NAD(P)-dependent dehydrogenase (short-subunit alcohol dehydrogenase family)
MNGAASVTIIIGAGGDIGAALASEVASREPLSTIHALSRRAPAMFISQIVPGVIDIGDEQSIRDAANAISAPVDRIVVATGILHEEGYGPERALRELDAGSLSRIFLINTIGPALALKYFTPLLARDRRTVFAILSARVGSISDNRSGGWYGYRASKAALNMIIRSAAIELARSRPESICVGLHPGTVDTSLSKPFQGRVAADRLFSPRRAACHLLDVMQGLSPQDSGRCFAWDGQEILP